MSAGNLISSGQRRTIRIIGEIDTPSELGNFVVKAEKGNPIYLKDVATVSFKDKDKTTYAREFGHEVVMLDVKKRAGKNMVMQLQNKLKLLRRLKQMFFHQI